MIELIDHVADALVAVSPAGLVLFWSRGAERVFGYSAAEAMQRALVELIIAPDQRPDVTDRFAETAVTGEVTCSGSFVRKDGTRVPVDISIRAVHDGATLSYFAVSMKDVTLLQHRRDETETALRMAYRELESLSYSIAHDLRAPLRGVNGFAQILLEDFAGQLPAEALDHLRDISDNAARMGGLIDALLSLSHVARSELHRKQIDLGSIARRIASRYATEVPDRTVELVTSGPLGVSADPALVRTLLEQLLGNAWKFTGATAQARVEIGATDGDAGRAFYVRDNGAGFDMAFADRLFGPFQRLHPAREFPGTGIGLAIAQRIVHRHGGRIWAEGNVGRGATFTFTLPEGAAP